MRILRLSALFAVALAGCPGPAPTATDFTVQPSRTLVDVEAGSRQTLSVTLSPQGRYTGTVTLSVEALPAGVTASPVNVEVSGTATSAELTFEARADAVPSSL